MTLTETIFTKVTLIRPHFVKNVYAEFDENPTDGLFTNTTSQDESDLHVRLSYLLFTECLELVTALSGKTFEHITLHLRGLRFSKRCNRRFQSSVMSQLRR